MTDLIPPRNGGPNTDADESGRVNLNKVLSKAYIIQAKKNLKSGNTPYKGDSHPRNFAPRKGQLLFSMIGSHFSGYNQQTATDRRPQVFANFLGFPQMPVDDINDKIHFEGCANGSGGLYDEINQYQHIDLSANTGGGFTIVNNSDVVIKCGQEIMYSAPPPGKVEMNNQYRNSELFLAVIQPYEPSVHKLTIARLLNFWRNPDSVQAKNWDASAKEEADKFKNILIKLANTNDLENLLATPTTEDTTEVESDLEELFALIERFNLRHRKRIFATATSDAAPGSNLDIMLGRGYSAV